MSTLVDRADAVRGLLVQLAERFRVPGVLTVSAPWASVSDLVAAHRLAADVETHAFERRASPAILLLAQELSKALFLAIEAYERPAPHVVASVGAAFARVAYHASRGV